MNIKDMSLEALRTYATEQRDAGRALLTAAGDNASDEQLSQIEGFAANVTAAETEIAEREQAAQARADRFAAMRETFAEQSADEDADEDAASAVETAASADESGDEDADGSEDREEFSADGGEGSDEDSDDSDDGDADNEDDDSDEEDADENADADEADAGEGATVTASRNTGTSTRRAVAKRAKRPQAPAAAQGRGLTITASADVPDFAMGQKLDGLDQLSQALTNRAKGLPKFNPARQTRSDTPLYHKFGVASLELDFPAELTVDRGSDHFAVTEHARKESRLPEGSLTAAGGWCAPSETVYDLCEGETLDGLISVPEINVKRGGVNYTSGPMFADVFPSAADFGFLQTEAEAIAGVEKECMEIECPEFDEIRLDAIGYCVTIPLLTEAGYPELIRRYLSLANVAYQRKRNFETITRMVAESTARSVAGLGAVVTDSLEGLEIIADQEREKYALSLNHTFEVVLPHWIRGAFRSDLARRNGVGVESVSDAQVAAHFASRKLNVQYVYDFQTVGTGTTYPDTYTALMYPAGTFTRGVTDVINLSAVYDAASLSVNTYTGVFFEQGLLVMKNCYDSHIVTLPVCTAGAQGALEFSCATPGDGGGEGEGEGEG